MKYGINSQTNLHPEQGENEIFMGNVLKPSNKLCGFNWTEDKYLSSPNSDFEAIGWNSKRMGKTAYCSHGEVLPEMVPVFIKKQEVADFVDELKSKLESETDKIRIKLIESQQKTLQEMIDSGSCSYSFN